MKENPCIRFSHIGEDGSPVYKEKICFNSDKEAIEFAKKMNKMNATHMIHKLIAYKCPKCCKWHVGRSMTQLSEKNRIKIINGK